MTTCRLFFEDYFIILWVYFYAGEGAGEIEARKLPCYVATSTASFTTLLHVQHIGPACLPSKGEDFTGKTATAIGWGKLSETDAEHSSVLRQVDLEIISNTLCQVDYGPWINECHMCVDTYYGQKVGRA
jgi:hypothetical protein